MHLNIRRIGSAEPSPKVTGKNTKIFLNFIFATVKTFSRTVVNNFTMCQNRIMIFRGGIKIFLLYFSYLLLLLRLGPTCHRITHQIFTYLIFSLHPLATLFPTHKAFIIVLEDDRKWMEEGAPNWRAGGADRLHQQADRPPPSALFK
jgi:hypothetical protein